MKKKEFQNKLKRIKLKKRCKPMPSKVIKPKNKYKRIKRIHEEV